MLKYFKTMVYSSFINVEVVSKHIYQKYGVFLKNIILFVFLFYEFYLIFDSPSILIFNCLKNWYFLKICPWT